MDETNDAIIDGGGGIGFLSPVADDAVAAALEMTAELGQSQHDQAAGRQQIQRIPDADFGQQHFSGPCPAAVDGLPHGFFHRNGEDDKHRREYQPAEDVTL